MPSADTFSSLPNIRAADARLIACATRSLTAWWQPDAWQAHMSQMIGCPVAINIRPVELVAQSQFTKRLGPDLFAAILCSRPDGKVKIVVEIEMHLAACVMDRLLGAEADLAIANRITPFNETEQGILAYFVSRMLVASKLDTWRLHSMASRPDAMQALSQLETWFVWPVHIGFGTVEGYARIIFPHDALEYCTSLVTHASAPQFNPEIPLELVVQLTTLSLSAHDIASLRPGDIVMLGQTPTATESSRFWEGALQLLLVGNPGYTWTATYKGNGELAVASVAKGDSMSDATLMSTETAAIDLDQVRETPVALSVELGRFRLSLLDVGQLLPGQVVQTGLTPGSEVTIRAGEKAVAFGELVNVDGELGVRITRI
jgi:type III secretion system YscQ/HrcQ family protein